MSKFSLKSLQLAAWTNLYVSTYECPWWTLGMTDKGCAESYTLEPLIQSRTVQLQRQSHHMATLQPVFLFKKVYILQYVRILRLKDIFACTVMFSIMNIYIL